MRVTTGMWTNNIMLFLFDHQLVYCKKDILKRNTYVYKGRIYLDTSEVIDVPDGKGKTGTTFIGYLNYRKISHEIKEQWINVISENFNLYFLFNNLLISS